MGKQAVDPSVVTEHVLLGDEAVSMGALHAGISAAYAYPGTPSTEMLEYLQAQVEQGRRITAHWCANEKTAYEQALGVSMMGRRALVAMKHVGLNVAADPFMNSALVAIHGGLVVAVADDPGMHSSQNEQDSRYFADFARILCLEPADQQEAYEMTREAFELSERFRIPVMVRLVTRLAHSRAVVRARPEGGENVLDKTDDPRAWTLLPANARRLWHGLLEKQAALQAYSEGCAHNRLDLRDGDRGLGVITTGLARNYYRENLADLEFVPSHLHIGAYPFPVGRIRALAAHVQRILLLEEGYPFLERYLRGILPQTLVIRGKEGGPVRADGELTPDNVRDALGLQTRKGMQIPGTAVPPRPPQLCKGCPHRDTFAALLGALEGLEARLVASDIGCYTLGALPPIQAIESCVCMGASVGMAKGAADAGQRPVIAVLGDSTFLHSGVTPLMDAVAANTDMTLVILDNGTVGMTGSQPTILPSSRLPPLIVGLGVPPEHCHVVEVHPTRVEAIADVLRRAMDHRGLSVVVATRECLVSARRRMKAERKKA